MLRRRILASAMASVMALGSVAVVANAEDTQVVSKADLEKLVNETYGDNFRANELSEYGSVSAEAVLDALEAADTILFDAEADEEDYTVAYKMVEATVARLVIYTAEELQALIDECKAIYDTNNILNEELQDQIYDPETFGKFTEAYENACDFVTSTSSVDITEAYELLAKAKSDLKKNTVVSKQMFRNVMRQYEALIADEHKYESWRRGAFGGWIDLNSGNYWMVNSGVQATYGMVWTGLMTLQDDINEAYNAIDAIKTLSKTSDTAIVDGYKLAQDAVNFFSGWTVDDSTRATKSGVNALLKEYHNVLVYDYALTSAEELYAAIAAEDDKMEATSISTTYATVDAYVGSWANSKKLIDASWTVKPTKAVYVPVDADGKWTGEGLKSGSRPSQDLLKTMEATKWQAISANSNFEIMKLVAIDPAAVTADLDHVSGGEKFAGWGNITVANAVMDEGSEWMQGWGKVLYAEPTAFDYVNDQGDDVYNSTIMMTLRDMPYNNAVLLSNAYALAMDYLDGDKEYKTMTDAIDTTGVVAGNDAKGNSKEWALVYRYLKYALEDKYEGSVSTCNHTKADVKALIEKAYELADLTGDAQIFEASHMALVEARQTALDWVKEANADKKYKEYTPAEDSSYVSSNDAYHALETAYGILEKEYNALKYSFGDIYDRIAEVSMMIDDGDLDATADLVAALDECAYRLSVVSDTLQNGYEDDAAFDVDRTFLAHNRVITNTGDPQTIAQLELEGAGDDAAVTTKDGANPTHAALVAAYDALNAAVKAQTEVTALKGDVDGNGTVNVLDASALLINLVNGVAMDAAVADYDANGAINVLDASAILVALVNA